MRWGEGKRKRKWLRGRFRGEARSRKVLVLGCERGDV